MRGCLVSSRNFPETGMDPHHLLKFFFLIARHFLECLLYLNTLLAPLLCISSPSLHLSPVRKLQCCLPFPAEELTQGHAGQIGDDAGSEHRGLGFQYHSSMY